MKKKIVLLLIIIAVIIGGIVVNKKQYNQKDNLLENNQLDSDVVYNLEYSMSYAIDVKNPNEMYKGFEYIAIIYVDKVFSATTYREKTNEYIMPYTSGEATILKTIKGNFEDNKISFLRLGGKVTYEDYEKSLSPLDKEKFNQHYAKNSKGNTYITDMAKGDISIEEGKTYLVYMVRDDNFHNKNEYTIDAFEYGLREIKDDENYLDKDITKILVKNNETGSYEKIDKLVNNQTLEKINKEIKK